MPVKDTPPALLLRAVLSVFDQDCVEPIEVVVWDDGSTDRNCRRAMDMLQLYSRPGRTLQMHGARRNAGISAARNAACNRAKGTWFVWLDSDDELPGDAIRNLLRAGGSHADVQFKVGQCDVVLPDGRRVTHRNKDLLDVWARARGSKTDPLLSSVFAVHGSMIHRDLFCENRFDTDLTHGELTDWFLRVLAGISTDHVVVIPESTYIYYKRYDSHSADRAAMERQRQFALLRYALMTDFTPLPWTEFRRHCPRTGARRYDLKAKDGSVLFAADAEFIEHDVTTLLPPLRLDPVDGGRPVRDGRHGIPSAA